MNNLKDLKIWNKAMELTAEVYEATNAFPAEERIGLVSQIRRAAVSIPSNIAEGAGRNSIGEFSHFLGIANGSSYELQTQVIISTKLNLLNPEMSDRLLRHLEELQKMTYAFLTTLKSKSQISNLTSQI